MTFLAKESREPFLENCTQPVTTYLTIYNVKIDKNIYSGYLSFRNSGYLKEFKDTLNRTMEMADKYEIQCTQDKDKDIKDKIEPIVYTGIPDTSISLKVLSNCIAYFN